MRSISGAWPGSLVPRAANGGSAGGTPATRASKYPANQDFFYQKVLLDFFAFFMPQDESKPVHTMPQEGQKRPVMSFFPVIYHGFLKKLL